MPQTLEGKPGAVFRHDIAPSPIHRINTTFTHAFGCLLEPPRGSPSDCCVAWICHYVKWFSNYEHVSLFLLKCQVWKLKTESKKETLFRRYSNGKE